MNTFLFINECNEAASTHVPLSAFQIGSTATYLDIRNAAGDEVMQGRSFLVKFSDKIFYPMPCASEANNRITASPNGEPTLIFVSRKANPVPVQAPAGTAVPQPNAPCVSNSILNGSSFGNNSNVLNVMIPLRSL